MPDYILAHHPTNGWQKIEERALPNEAALQNLIRDNPDILPLDDLGDAVSALLVVGRETTLPNGYADAIGVDEGGLVTIIECKLDRNSEVKREVVGQVLGYAAYLWQMTYSQFEQEVARKYFDSPRCNRNDLRGVGLDEAMKRFREERSAESEWNEETFRQRLGDNLKSGRFRLVIVVDKVNDELRRTVEYLNQCTEPSFQIVCAELRYFAAGHIELIVPALIGATSGKGPHAPGPTRKWDAAQFFAEIRQKWGEPVAEATRRLLKWAEQNSDYVWWGEGTRDGSFVPTLRWTADRGPRPFVVYTYGRLEVTFQYFKAYPPFDDVNRRKTLLQKFNEIDGIAFPEDSFDRRPSFELQLLTDDRFFDAFTRVMGEMIGELRSARATIRES